MIECQGSDGVGSRDASLPVSFEADGFKSGARKILAECRKSTGQFVRDLERDLHLNTRLSPKIGWLVADRWYGLRVRRDFLAGRGRGSDVDWDGMLMPS